MTGRHFRITVMALLVALAVPWAVRGQTVRFVNHNATGANDCSSWPNACTDLQDALQRAEPGDQVWVAAGAYLPDGGTGDRSATFALLTGVTVYGGFAGSETSLGQRNPAANLTILAGVLAGDDGPNFANYGENSLHILTASDVDETAILDGFFILGGNANGTPGLEDRGAGLLVLDASPTVTACVFLRNAAAFGGASHCSGNASATFTDCAFVDNVASSGGGGMYNDDGAIPALTRCAFLENSSPMGGAVLNNNASPTLVTCTLTNNAATSTGGGISNTAGSDPQLMGCRFITNIAAAGGGMYNTGDSNPNAALCEFRGNLADSGAAVLNLLSSPAFNVCIFAENVATAQGGGVFNSGGAARFTDCGFLANRSASNGAGMVNLGSSPQLLDCNFAANISAASGGGMFNSGSGPSLSGCVFLGNAAALEGGGMANLAQSSPTLGRCMFLQNQGELGGGMFNRDRSHAALVSCLLNGNSAGSGGAIFNLASSPLLTNCTITANDALKFVGGLYNSASSRPAVTSCILWGNGDEGGTDESAQLFGGQPSIGYSTIEGCPVRRIPPPIRDSSTPTGRTASRAPRTTTCGFQPTRLPSTPATRPPPGKSISTATLACFAAGSIAERMSSGLATLTATATWTWPTSRPLRFAPPARMVARTPPGVKRSTPTPISTSIWPTTRLFT